MMESKIKRLIVFLGFVLCLGLAGRAATWQLHLGDRVYDFSETIADHFFYVDFEDDDDEDTDTDMHIAGKFYISNGSKVFDAGGLTDIVKGKEYSVAETSAGSTASVGTDNARDFRSVRLYFDSEDKKIYIADLWYYIQARQVDETAVPMQALLMIPFLQNDQRGIYDAEFSELCQRLYLPQLLRLDENTLLRLETYDGSRILGQLGKKDHIADLDHIEVEHNYGLSGSTDYEGWFRTPDYFITEITADHVDDPNSQNITFRVPQWYLMLNNAGSTLFDEYKMGSNANHPGYRSVSLGGIKVNSRFYFKAKTSHFDYDEFAPQGGDVMTATGYDFASAPLFDGEVEEINENRSYYLFDSNYATVDVYFNDTEEKVALVSRELYYIVGKYFGEEGRLPMYRYSGLTDDGQNNIYYIDLPKLPYDTHFHFEKEVSGELRERFPITAAELEEWQIVEPLEWSKGSNNAFNGKNYFTVDETYDNVRIYVRDNTQEVTITGERAKFDPKAMDGVAPVVEPRLVVYSAGDEAGDIAGIELRKMDFFGNIGEPISFTRGWNGEEHLFSLQLDDPGFWYMDFLITYKDGSTRSVEPFKGYDEGEPYNPENIYPADFYDDYDWDAIHTAEEEFRHFSFIFGPWVELDGFYTSYQSYLTPEEYLQLYRAREQSVTHLAGAQYTAAAVEDGVAVIESEPEFRLSWMPADALNVEAGKKGRSSATFSLGQIGPKDDGANLKFNTTVPYLAQSAKEWKIDTSNAEGVKYRVVVDREYESLTAVGFDPAPVLTDFSVAVAAIDAADLDIDLSTDRHLLKGSTYPAVAYPDRLNTISGTLDLTPAYFSTENLSGNAAAMVEDFKANYSVSYAFYSCEHGGQADADHSRDSYIGTFSEPLGGKSTLNVHSLSGDGGDDVTLMARAIYTDKEGASFRSAPVFVTAPGIEISPATPELEHKATFINLFKSLDENGAFDAAGKWHMHFDIGFKVDTELVYFPEFEAESNGATGVQPAHKAISGIFGEDGLSNVDCVYEGYTPWDGNSDYLHSAGEGGDAHNNWSIFFRDLGHINAVINDVADDEADVTNFNLTVRLKYPFVRLDIDSDKAVTLAPESAAAAAPARKAAATKQAVKKISYATPQTYAIYSSASGGDITGIDDIAVETDAAEAEYFNLQGVRIAKPTQPGIYIERKGRQTRKVRF